MHAQGAQRKIQKLLIAHRSEIALRIHRTAHAHGIATIAIYTAQDSTLSYVYYADEAYKLSGTGLQGYLNQEEIIEIALKAGAHAIHPGYGFLSENAHFAQKVINAGLIWIGPAPEVITLLGDKSQARSFMAKRNIPIVPGFYINAHEQDAFETAFNKAFTVGYPLLVKDPLGGGGKGMRKITHPEDFERNWETVKREALTFTGSKVLLIEKYLEHTRHIEIQIAGDAKKIIHLYERECSLQRRHQKIIEETPCNFVSQKTLDQMYQVACAAAKAVNYTSVGTVEFLVTADEHFYFLEMNTRLQVEHAVTELTVGLDLVALQLDVAQGNEIPQQHELTRRGHAIECRINAEDPKQNFLPSGGIISHLELPEGPFVRHDHDLHEGLEISSFFDPLISKVITFGKDRTAAVNAMSEALRSFTLGGIATNISFLEAVLCSQEFLDGMITTQSLNNTPYLAALLKTPNSKSASDDLLDEEKAVLAVAINLLLSRQKQHNNQQPPDPLQSHDVDWYSWKKQAW